MFKAAQLVSGFSHQAIERAKLAGFNARKPKQG
jgi:hypothetical protein